MKRYYSLTLLTFVISTLSSLFLNSCGGLPEPKSINSTELKCWVYNQCFPGTTCYEPRTDNFREIKPEEKAFNTQLVEWSYNSESIGDSYTGYFVIYYITELCSRHRTRYALIDLLEFEDSGRYEYRLIAESNNLSEINNYLDFE